MFSELNAFKCINFNYKKSVFPRYFYMYIFIKNFNINVTYKVSRFVFKNICLKSLKSET